jgi:hypothetical protein
MYINHHRYIVIHIYECLCYAPLPCGALVADPASQSVSQSVSHISVSQ